MSDDAGEQGLVYLIEGGGLVKVGWTSQDARKRLSALQCGSPLPLRYLGALPAYRSLERDLHARMARWRSHGEWFRWNHYAEACLIVARLLSGDRFSEPYDDPDSYHYSRVSDILQFASAGDLDEVMAEVTAVLAA